jgi:hypothetical protein
LGLLLSTGTIEGIDVSAEAINTVSPRRCSAIAPDRRVCLS